MKESIHDGLPLIVSEDGFLMRLIASGGNTLDVEMLPIIGELDPIDVLTMVLWVPRLGERDATTIDLPVDVRESLEAKIDGVATRTASE